MLAGGFGSRYPGDTVMRPRLIDSILMPSDGCVERAKLSRDVVEAVAKVYQARSEYNPANQKRTATIDALAVVLQKARGEGRAALPAVGEQKQHGCEV